MRYSTGRYHYQHSADGIITIMIISLQGRHHHPSSAIELCNNSHVISFRLRTTSLCLASGMKAKILHGSLDACKHTYLIAIGLTMTSTHCRLKYVLEFRYVMVTITGQLVPTSWCINSVSLDKYSTTCMTSIGWRVVLWYRRQWWSGSSSTSFQALCMPAWLTTNTSTATVSNEELNSFTWTASEPSLNVVISIHGRTTMQM